MLTNYTSFDSVRAVIGISSRIFPDTSLSNEIYVLDLRLRLTAAGQSVLLTANLDRDYLLLTGVLPPVAQNFHNAVRLFSAHAVAFKALTALPEMSPTHINVNKAASLKKEKVAVEGLVIRDYMTYRRLLIVAYAAFLNLSVPLEFQPNIGVASTLDFDPVTGR